MKIEPERAAIIKPLADFIRKKKFKFGQYYEYRCVMLKTKDGVSFFREYLCPIKENDVWGYEQENNDRMKIQDSLLEDKK